MTDFGGSGLPGPADDGGDGEENQRNRPSRLPVDAMVTLNTEHGGVEAHACDVSENGLKIETDTPLASGPISVKMVGFPIFSGQVRWNGGRQVGIEFVNPIPWDFLTAWVKAHGFRRN